MRRAGSGRIPHPATIIGALSGAAIALSPGSLPRDVTVHGALLTALLLFGAGVGAIIGRLTPRRTGKDHVGTRRAVAVVAASVFVALVGLNAWWQDDLREALGVPAVGFGFFAASLAPVTVWVCLVAAPRFTAVVLGTVGATVLGVAPAVAGPHIDDTGRATAFVATDATPASMRLYSSLDGRSVEHRAADLAGRWSAAGGARRAAVVVAVPTGSGWVDPDALRGFEQRLRGDVAIIAMQYDDIPSWQAFVSDADTARRSAVALIAALFDAVARVPESRRPQIYLYGQSLGAIGADAARAWVDDARRGNLCATVLVGPPAGTVATQARRRVVLANGSDPVAAFSPRLLWAPPTRWSGRADLPRPPWIPIASFVQTSADLLGALSFPAGHGHQYGTEQGMTAPLCSGQTSAPRAASYAAPTR